MAEKDKNAEEPLSTEDVDQFLRKLDAWAATLDSGERALLQLIVEQSAGNVGETVDLTFDAEGGVGSAVEPFLRARAEGLALKLPSGGKRPQRPRAWVQAGEPWIQGA